MRFIPQSPGDRSAMLGAIGAGSVEELFADIPEGLRFKRPLDLPGPLPELDLAEYFADLAAKNRPVSIRKLFTGAGAYPHHVPVAVDQLLLRAELFTCYTPYQPEVSQGTLAAIYEFQTYTAALTQMDVANASMYDGASALAEAVAMAARIKKKPKVVLSNLIHPHWREVTATYTRHLDARLVTADCLSTGVSTVAQLGEAVDGDTAAVVVQYPNFFGAIEDLEAIRNLCDSAGAMMIVAVAEPVALGLLKGPGAYGADIVAAEGRSFGGALSYGGPALGMFAVKQKFARQIPGRLVGKTKDDQGREGYVLTLSTREQHIRREKATSNICSNQALCATAAAIHLSLLGREGLRDMAERNLSAARYLEEKVCSIEGFVPVYQNPYFNEFAVRTPVEPAVINKRLATEGIVGGHCLGEHYPELDSAMLLCATEVHTKKTIDRLAEILSEFSK